MSYDFDTTLGDIIGWIVTIVSYPINIAVNGNIYGAKHIDLIY